MSEANAKTDEQWKPYTQTEAQRVMDPKRDPDCRQVWKDAHGGIHASFVPDCGAREITIALGSYSSEVELGDWLVRWAAQPKNVWVESDIEVRAMFNLDARRRLEAEQGQGETVCAKEKLPAECVKCGAATGPMCNVGDDHAGWLCPACYEAIAKLEESESDMCQCGYPRMAHWNPSSDCYCTSPVWILQPTPTPPDELQALRDTNLKLLAALTMLYDKYEDGADVWEEPEAYIGPLGKAVKLSADEEDSILDAFESAGVPTCLSSRAALAKEPK